MPARTDVRLAGGGMCTGDRVSLLEPRRTHINQSTLPRGEGPSEAQLDRASGPFACPQGIRPLLEIVIEECPEAEQPALGRLPGDAEAAGGAPERLVTYGIRRVDDGIGVEVRTFV